MLINLYLIYSLEIITVPNIHKFIKKPLTVVKSGGVETADSQSVKGLNWAIKVERCKVGGCAATSGFPKDPQNYDLLLRGNGLRCMTKVKDVVTGYANCGSYSESW